MGSSDPSTMHGQALQTVFVFSEVKEVNFNKGEWIFPHHICWFMVYHESSLIIAKLAISEVPLIKAFKERTYMHCKHLEETNDRLCQQLGKSRKFDLNLTSSLYQHKSELPDPLHTDMNCIFSTLSSLSVSFAKNNCSFFTTDAKEGAISHIIHNQIAFIIGE